MRTYTKWIEFLEVRSSVEEAQLRKESRDTHEEKIQTYLAFQKRHKKAFGEFYEQ
jgi:hypothetical protein